jgi:GNAT superfamily N-acetyltransferase
MVDEGELEFWVGRATPEVARAVERIYEAGGDPRSRETVEWQYLQVPGGAYVAIAYDRRGLVAGASAMCAALPVTFQVGGRSEPWVQLIDLLTLPAWRGHGLAVRLQKKLYDMIVADGARAAYGFPHDGVLPMYERKLDYYGLGPVPMFVRPVGLRYLRVRTGLREPAVADRTRVATGVVRAVERCPKDVDQLLQGSADGSDVGVQRDHEYLAWRLRRPDGNYALFESRRADGTLEAFGASALKLKHGCALGYIMELMSMPDSRTAATRLARAMVKDLRYRQADLILSWNTPGSSSRRALARAGFVSFPTALRPISLYAICKPADPAIKEVVRDRRNWRISYFDSDTV